VRQPDQIVHVRERGLVHAEPRQVEPPGLFVQEPQHDALAVPGGDGRDAHIDGLAGHAQRDPPVLREPLLGDVELRHDLHPRDDRGVQGAGGLEQVAQRAIDAQAHERARLEGLDVDVRGAVAQRLREQRIDEADDRRVVLAFQKVLDLGNFLQQPRQIDVLREVVGERRGTRSGAVVQGRDEYVEFAGADAARPQGNAEHAADFGERPRRRVVAHCHLRGPVSQGRDDDAVRLCERVRNGGRRLDHRDAGGVPAGGAGRRAGRLGGSMSGRTALAAGLTLPCSPRM